MYPNRQSNRGTKALLPPDVRGFCSHASPSPALSLRLHPLAGHLRARKGRGFAIHLDTLFGPPEPVLCSCTTSLPHWTLEQTRSVWRDLTAQRDLKLEGRRRRPAGPSVSCFGFDEEFGGILCCCFRAERRVVLWGLCRRGCHLVLAASASSPTRTSRTIRCFMDTLHRPCGVHPREERMPRSSLGTQNANPRSKPTRDIRQTRTRCGAASACRTRGQTRTRRGGRPKRFSDRARLLLQHAALAHEILGGGFLCSSHFT